MKNNTISEQNKSKIVQALKQISAKHGEDIFFEAERFDSIIRDVLADANLSNVCEWLTSIIRMGAYNQLKCALENGDFIREATKIAYFLHKEKNADINFAKEITGIITAVFTDNLVFADIDDTENIEGITSHKINKTSEAQAESLVQPTIYAGTVIIYNGEVTYQKKVHYGGTYNLEPSNNSESILTDENQNDITTDIKKTNSKKRKSRCWLRFRPPHIVLPNYYKKHPFVAWSFTVIGAIAAIASIVGVVAFLATGG